MTRHVTRKLIVRVCQRLGLVVFIGMMVPFALSQAPDDSASRSEGGELPKFAVVSVRMHTLNDNRWKARFTPDGYHAIGVTPQMLIRQSYGLSSNDQPQGQPDWVKNQRFDIEAKVDEADVARFQALDVDQRDMMIQELLSDRFKLQIRYETKILPVYALVIQKGGPKLKETGADHVPSRMTKGFGGLILKSSPGILTVQWETMEYFAKLLSQLLERTVVNRTELAGHYDIDLQWKPDDTSSTVAGPDDSTLSSSDGPSIFAAIQEQLGLSLRSEKGPVQQLVVVHIEQPSAN